MATLSSMKFNKGPLLEQPDLNMNMNYTYNNNRFQNTAQIMQGSGTLTSQEKYYTNLYTANQNSMFFSFKERSGKLRWKEIMRLDIETMIKNNDISPLENHLENLIFSNVNENDVEVITENITVKLIKIYQHILEYLLHTQIRLENENKMLETNYNQALNESIIKETALKENKTLIGTLKKDKREKENILTTYKCIIEEYKKGGFANTINYNNTKNNKLSSSVNPYSSSANDDKKQYFFCKYCSGKKFSSEEYLNNHMQRRHGKNKNETIDKNDLDITDLRQSRRDYVKNLENSVEELKNLFHNFIKNNSSNEYFNKLAENQKVLENKLGDVKNDKEKTVNLMEENFKKTLLEIKEFVKSSVNNNNHNSSYKDDYHENESLIKQKEGIDTIKSNINDMNTMISEIKKNQNEKMQNVYDQLNNIKTTISSELKEIKINTSASRQTTQNDFHKMNNINPVYQSFSDNKYKGGSIEITNAFSISNLQEKVKNNNKDANNIKVVKPCFNAGPLESDNSDDEKSNFNNLNIKKNESVKFSLNNNNNNNNNLIITREKNDISDYKKNHIKNKLEQQKLKNPKKSEIEEILTVNKSMPKDTNDKEDLYRNNSKDKKIHENDDISQDKVIDISNITKEKKKDEFG